MCALVLFMFAYSHRFQSRAAGDNFGIVMCFKLWIQWQSEEQKHKVKSVMDFDGTNKTEVENIHNRKHLLKEDDKTDKQ